MMQKNQKYHTKNGTIKSSKKRKVLKICLITLITIFVVGIITFAVWLKKNVFEGLPDVTQVKDMQFQQATIITDRNGVELYKLFEENREYVDIDDINQHMIDALVAIEDQRYWEHEGLDPWGILRAAIKRTGGASTLPQQLMTNVFDLKKGIGNAKYGTFEYYEERAKYKLRQIVLSKRLNTVLSNQIKQEKPNLSNEEIKYEMKRKILEMYLNYIELGNHSFGIEAASQTYFGVHAKDLTVIQSSILASLPKGPGQYNPFTENGRNLLMGSFEIKDANGKEYPYEEGNIKQQIISQFTTAIKQGSFQDKKDSSSIIKYLVGLGSFSVVDSWKEYYIKYKNGRKDLVIARMLEDKYITEEELKTAYIEGLRVEFKSSAFQIKAPHFVFWIRDLLQEQFGDDVATKGLVVRTTLDYDVQQQAERVLRENEKEIFENGANNSAMLYLNTDNGDVLAYVGSLDYFNTDIQGQNDMVRKPRQSGSTIKPLLYALGFMSLPLTIDTPIYDLPFSVGGKTPHNADGAYEGLLPLKKALGHSRNIPSVKMFLALGGENIVKPFYQKLGLTNILDSQNYGYSLSLGAAEVPMLQLAAWYAHLTTETPAVINPILEVKNHNGSILYDKENDKKEHEEVIPLWVKYLLWEILSDPNNRLVGWISKFNVAGLQYALKTWTTNVVIDGKSRPRDGWVVGYVPDRLVLIRAGNADAKPMSANAYGGTIHAAPIKSFLKWLLDNNHISNRSMTNVDTSTATISKISWKLAGDYTPMDIFVKTIGYLKTMPSEKDQDPEDIEYDSSCIGEVSPLSSMEEIKRGYFLPNVESFMPENQDLNTIKEYLRMSASTGAKTFTLNGGKVTNANVNILLEKPQEYCEGKVPQMTDEIQISLLEWQENQNISSKPEIIVAINGENALEACNIYLDGQKVWGKKYGSEWKTEDMLNFLPDLSSFQEGKHVLSIEVINIKGFMNTKALPIVLKKQDNEAPELIKDKSLIKKVGDEYNVSFLFSDALSAVKGGKILASWEVIGNFEGRLATFKTKESQIDIAVEDAFENILQEEIDLSTF